MMNGEDTTGGRWRYLAARVTLSLALFGCFLGAAFGQRAPDITRGTSTETVIQRYGWPKGKGVTEGRESWIYESFQVLFEDGHVVAVSYISPTKAAPVIATSNSGKVLPPPAPTPRPTVRTPAPVPLVRAQPAPASDYLVKPPPGPLVAANSRKSLSWVLLLGVIASTALIGLGIVWVQQRAAARKLSDALIATPVVPAKRQCWEAHVAARLDQVNAGLAVTPGFGASPRPMIEVEVQRESRSLHLTRELLLSLEWKRLEQIVALYFEATGVDARCTCNGPDGGIDVKLYRKGEGTPYSYVQCKAWESERIKVTTMREFLGVMAADGIREGAFVTTSDFRPEARAFAEANQIVPINGSDFIARFTALPADDQARILAVVTDGDYATPTCVRCDRKMESRKRTKDGRWFWECRCRHTMWARSTAA